MIFGRTNPTLCQCRHDMKHLMTSHILQPAFSGITEKHKSPQTISLMFWIIFLYFLWFSEDKLTSRQKQRIRKRVGKALLTQKAAEEALAKKM